VLVVEEPVPIVELPELVKEVKAPVEAAEAPIAVEFIPVEVVLKFAEVKLKSLTPVEIEEAPRPKRAIAPLVPVKLSAPVVKVKPFEAVNKPAEVIVPAPVVEILLVVVKVPTVLIDNWSLEPKATVSVALLIWVRVVVALFQNP
jgi:hypothetical protein